MLDLLGKLYGIYSRGSIKPEPSEAQFLDLLSERVCVLEKPHTYEFTEHEKQTLESLWEKYGND